MTQKLFIIYLYRHLRKRVRSGYYFVASLCFRARVSAWINLEPTGRIFIKFYTLGVFFRKSVEGFQILLKSDKNNGIEYYTPSNALSIY